MGRHGRAGFGGRVSLQTGWRRGLDCREQRIEDPDDPPHGSAGLV